MIYPKHAPKHVQLFRECQLRRARSLVPLGGGGGELHHSWHTVGAPRVGIAADPPPAVAELGAPLRTLDGREAGACMRVRPRSRRGRRCGR